MRRQLLYSLIGILVLAYGGLIATLIAGDRPALGLDLQGGSSITLQPVGEYNVDSLTLAIERIRERVDVLGIAEPEIILQGDAIVVNLPNVKDQAQAEAIVKVTGEVLLRPVLTETQFNINGCSTDPIDVPEPTTTTTTTNADTSAVTSSTATPGVARQVSSTNSTTTVTQEPTTTTADTGATTTTEPGATTTTEPGATTTTEVAVTDPTLPPVPADQEGFVISQNGTYCKVGPAGANGEIFEQDAKARVLQNGWGVTVSLRDGAAGVTQWNAIASQCFATAPTCPTGQIAIVLDGEVISAPVVQTDQFSGAVQIDGSRNESEARKLAEVINSGSLPVKLEAQAVQTVSPTLGKDSLRAAVIAGLVGVGLVLLFMACYYRTLGLVAAAGLTVSGALLWTVISYLSRANGLALSLAGVAGIIVAVGVTIDSYVVFFERLKDEVRGGRTLRNSAPRAFTGAWRTIVVADLVSLIGALVLWYLSVGSVRNFAFFLGLSTLCDLFVSYFFTRPTVLLLARTKWMSRRKVMGIEVTQAVAT